MGIIFSRFRKKKTTIEVLEQLDTKIKEIEQYGQNTEQKHKKIVGRLVIYSVILYIMTAFIFYFYCFPASLYDQLYYITPLLLFPILILLSKKLVTWYYKRKISQNQKMLTTMQEQKKKILDEVTETETYKKAKEILLKFAPDQLKMTPLSPQASNIVSNSDTPRRVATPQNLVSPLSTSNELRKRVFAPVNRSINLTGTTPSNINHKINSNATPTVNIQHGTPIQAGKNLPRPIISQHKNYIDRLVDYLVGDGPSNRFALICSKCGSHNGMALKEEFEYFSYRCWSCNFWNPARKQKPNAPKLDTSRHFTIPLPSVESNLDSTLSTNLPNDHLEMNAPKDLSTEDLVVRQDKEQPTVDTPSPSDSDSDIEVVEKPHELPEAPNETINEYPVEQQKSEAIPESDKIFPEKEDKEENERMEVDEDFEK